MSKPSIPQGTRDFSPIEVKKRQYILNILKRIFELYAFQPLETPAMENLLTLTGKYGEEGDRLIFKILNNGLNEQTDEQKSVKLREFKRILNYEEFDELKRPVSTPEITERALRYDLTIPFARYVVMHQNEIVFPFRRYQMQPVWRADRPQKGRYREFWQCDCDIIGTNSLIAEAELFQIYQLAFHELKIPVTLKVNSRKVLAGLAEICGIPDKLVQLTIALDKLDKIGWDGVMNELQSREIPLEKVHIIKEITENTQKGTLHQRIGILKDFFTGSEIGLAGIAEIERALKYHKILNSNDGHHQNIEIDITLARGLNYYTGVILEVVCASEKVKMGSLGGGGRYDDLTGLFGLKSLSGVGISFGIDRIYDVMDEMQLFSDDIVNKSPVFVANFGGENETYALNILRQLRESGIEAEFYPEATKFDKQMKYANRRGIKYVVIAGDEERIKEMISLKNFESGKQTMTTIDEAITILLTGIK